MSDVDSAKSPADERPVEERRIHHNLRLIFDAACLSTASFFDASKGWDGNSSKMYARQTLRDVYPELSQQELAILFSAVQRFHTTKKK